MDYLQSGPIAFPLFAERGIYSAGIDISKLLPSLAAFDTNQTHRIKDCSFISVSLTIIVQGSGCKKENEGQLCNVIKRSNINFILWLLGNKNL